MPETAARVLGKRLFSARVRRRDFVLEGGGIEVNGRGTLLTTEECYLSRGRRCATRAWGARSSRRPCATTSA